MRWVVTWALIACGGAPTPPPTQVPPAGEAAAAVHALADQAFEALARCDRAVASKLDVEALDAITLTPEALEAGCAAVGALFDAHNPEGIGQTRSGDWLLSELARVGEDVDYLGRELASAKRKHLRSAVEHLQGSIPSCTRVATQVRGETTIAPMAAGMPRSLGAAESRWPALVRSGEMDYAKLTDVYDRYADQQGLDPRNLRDRMLQHYGLAATAQARELRVFAELDGAPAAWKAYADATEAFVVAYQASVAAYLGGAVRSNADRETRRETVQAAAAAWREAWTAAAP
jgi:hypothetical protein